MADRKSPQTRKPCVSMLQAACNPTIGIPARDKLHLALRLKGAKGASRGCHFSRRKALRQCCKPHRSRTSSELSDEPNLALRRRLTIALYTNLRTESALMPSDCAISS